MTILTGGTLSRRAALALMATAAVSVCGAPQSEPRGPRFVTALTESADGAQTVPTGSTRYAHDTTPGGHLLVTDLQTGQRLPVTADYSQIAAFGSSTLKLAGPRLAAEFRGIPFHNEAHGGEVAEETLARLGSRPLSVRSVMVPESGAAAVRDEDPDSAIRFKAPCAGTLAGVDGDLTANGRRHGAFTFTRARPGDPAEAEEGEAFRPGHGLRGCILLLNLGKNNLNGATGTHDVDTLLEWTGDAVAWNGGDAVLVMGHFVNTHTRRTGSALRDRVTAYNEGAREEFGRRFFDVGEFITSTDVWEYAGISPTAADRRQQRAGNKPPSLSRDRAHLNPAGDAAIARRIHEHLADLGWVASP